MGAGKRPGDEPAGGGRLKAGFVLLVGLSGGTIALQGGASPLVVCVSILVGVAAGTTLLWYLLWVSR